MDSTPIQPQPISSIKPSSTKLPIKRKDSSFNPDSPILITPKFEPITPDYLLDDEDDDDGYTNNLPVGGIGDSRPPPFKFHRIWTEPDEIRFLQGLLECSNQSFSFPRDLGIFYSRFSNTMSQPYTKSQLSEKIRRLRKKFRVISTRLAKGLDKALLSPHDRALYELSKQLWHPDYANSSPFFNSGSGSGSKPVKSTLVGVKVSFSPVLPSGSTAVLALPSATYQETVQNSSATKIIDDQNKNHNGFDEFGKEFDGDVKLSEVNVELDDGVGEKEMPLKSDLWGEVENLAKKALVDVFDQTVEDVRMALDHRGSTLEDCLKGEREKTFEKRWREQRVVEFEVLAKRLRLIVEQSVEKQ